MVGGKMLPEECMIQYKEAPMSNRAVDLTRLKPNSVILLETINSVYEIVISIPEEKICYITGGERFRTTTEVKILGALKNGECRVGYIEIGSAIEIVPVGTNRTITTGAVQTAKVVAPKKEFSYEL